MYVVWVDERPGAHPRSPLKVQLACCELSDSAQCPGNPKEKARESCQEASAPERQSVNPQRKRWEGPTFHADT